MELGFVKVPSEIVARFLNQSSIGVKMSAGKKENVLPQIQISDINDKIRLIKL